MGDAPKTPPKKGREWVGSFKPKSINRNIHGTINPTNKRFKVRHYPKANTTWLAAAILKNDMT